MCCSVNTPNLYWKGGSMESRHNDHLRVLAYTLTAAANVLSLFVSLLFLSFGAEKREKVFFFYYTYYGSHETKQASIDFCFCHTQYSHWLCVCCERSHTYTSTRAFTVSPINLMMSTVHVRTAIRSGQHKRKRASTSRYQLLYRITDTQP